MASEREQNTVVVFDSTVLSNFAAVSRADYLAETFYRPATVDAVLKELRTGGNEGYQFLADAHDICVDVHPLTSDIEPSTASEAPHYIATSRILEKLIPDEIVQRLDEGEAHALGFCYWVENDSADKWRTILATDDMDARSLAD